jgi:hypothetical protein
MLDEIPGSLVKELAEKLDLPVPWNYVSRIDILPSHIKVNWFKRNDEGHILVEGGDVVVEGCALPIRWAK